MNEQVNRIRAKRIARTEILSASNYGALVGAMSNDFETTKHWVAVNDNRTRRHPRDKYDHLQMNKDFVDTTDYFIVSGQNAMYPGDPELSAGNRINCRCTLYFKAKRDEEGAIIPKKSILNIPNQQPSFVYIINILGNVAAGLSVATLLTDYQQIIEALRKIFDFYGILSLFENLIGNFGVKSNNKNASKLLHKEYEY
jgi:hypothetical protein